MSDNQMNRGKTQALYKYLPGSWIDFSVRGKNRKQYIAYVTRWNSEKLTDINQKRLIRVVDKAVRSFASQASIYGNTSGVFPISGYGEKLTQENCSVLTPKAGGEERGIISSISPLTFYCKKCMKVHQFWNADDYRKNSKCRTCHIELSQFRQIYLCKCGSATDKQPAYCKTHGADNIYWDGKYNFICKSCGPQGVIPMRRKCDTCGKQMKFKVALDPAQFFAYSLNLIDLIDEKVEEYITNTDYGPFITLAYWIGKISREDLFRIIQSGINSDETFYKSKYDEYYTIFKIAQMTDEDAATNAKAAAENVFGNHYKSIVKDMKVLAGTLTEDNILRLAESIIEYDMVKNSKDIVTLDKAIEVSQLLNTSANAREYMEIAEKLGITNTQVCGKIPFITCSYGFTRVENEWKEGVQLRSFKEEKRGITNIYAVKLETEGVLFEFDRKMILVWMIKNNYINIDDSLDINDVASVKGWFATHVKAESIEPFVGIDNIDKVTYYVYRLIHSISHILIRSCAEICGLDKNSLSEYIFPSIPAVLVYCQNSQGFNLGAMSNVFEAHFDRWMKRALELSQKCIFDPICSDRYKACAGCLFLNEISCEHFNKDLDRTLLSGHIEKEKNKRIIGFWEE